MAEPTVTTALVSEAIELAPLVARVSGSEDGAVAVFLGIVRDTSDAGQPVVRMLYEGYEAMAAEELARIGDEIAATWPDVRAVLVHRLGLLELGETSVAVVVASPHRGEAFDACRHGIERIKARLPIWKKEYGPDGEVWVEGSVAPEIAP